MDVLSEAEIADRLETLAQRQRAAFGYHLVDGLPVWNTPESDDHYTSDSYAREQCAPEEGRENA